MDLMKTLCDELQQEIDGKQEAPKIEATTEELFSRLLEKKFNELESRFKNTFETRIKELEEKKNATTSTEEVEEKGKEEDDNQPSVSTGQ